MGESQQFMGGNMSFHLLVYPISTPKHTWMVKRHGFVQRMHETYPKVGTKQMGKHELSSGNFNSLLQQITKSIDSLSVNPNIFGYQTPKFPATATNTCIGTRGPTNRLLGGSSHRTKIVILWDLTNKNDDLMGFNWLVTGVIRTSYQVGMFLQVLTSSIYLP